MSNRFADNLKALRLARGISQAELARAIDTSAGIISLWEHGKREPLMYSLISLATYFDVALDDLVGMNP